MGIGLQKTHEESFGFSRQFWFEEIMSRADRGEISFEAALAECQQLTKQLGAPTVADLRPQFLSAGE